MANTGTMTLSCSFCKMKLTVEGPTRYMNAAIRGAELQHTNECGGPGVWGADYVGADDPRANPHDKKEGR